MVFIYVHPNIIDYFWFVVSLRRIFRKDVVAFERQLLCFPCLTGQHILQAHEILLRVREGQCESYQLCWHLSSDSDLEI